MAIKRVAHQTFWFLVGFFAGATLLGGIILSYFQFTYKYKVIPGVFAGGEYIGNLKANEIEKIFQDMNDEIGKNTFIFAVDGKEATVSAKMLGAGFDVNLIKEQGLGLGKTGNFLSDIYIVLSSYIGGTFLNPVLIFNEENLKEALGEIHEEIYEKPIDAEFIVKNNRVVTFHESKNGRTIDYNLLNEKVKEEVGSLAKSNKMRILRIDIPIKILEPTITTDEANSFGIVEEIGIGRSRFIGSIPNRVHNVSLAASKMNGALLAPGEEFSFNRALGDVSRFTGYKEAYIIKDGRTILGDGGGVCQVSTTLFRAILDAGLPITERHPHSYRVGYYEQDSPPGLDATVYDPSADLKFKNDTGKHILIQAFIDPTNMSLVFTLYGKRDGRQVLVSKPVISNVVPAPPSAYQDDPTLPRGVERQVDFAAPGGKSVFERTVTKDGIVIISDTFVSAYRPWQAVFLRGTRE